VPQRDEREHPQRREEGSVRSAEGDVQIPDDPEVVAAVPGAPEPEDGIVVGHATDHVLGGHDPVEEGPEAEQPPREEELRSVACVNMIASRGQT
jgi:hypothetical protein